MVGLTQIRGVYDFKQLLQDSPEKHLTDRLVGKQVAKVFADGIKLED